MMLAVKDVTKMMNSKLKIYRHVRGNLVCSLEKGMATHSSILAWRNPMDRGARQATVHGVRHDRATNNFLS